MRVINIDGGNGTTCQCGSWLDHWKRFGGQLPTYCPEEGCYRKPEIGAHVQKDGSADKTWYILPLCSAHCARKGEVITVSDHVRLIPANTRETCGRT